MKSITTIVKVFLLWTLIGALTKPVFLLLYASMAGNIGVTDWLLTMWHGIRLDLAIAGYLSIIPALLLIINVWLGRKSDSKKKTVSALWKGYFILFSFLAALGYCVNLGLYPYWGFPLDSTPLLYIKTSPADAMASLTLWDMLSKGSAIIIFTIALSWLFLKAAKFPGLTRFGRIPTSIALFIIAGLMIIPIRGGFGTGTNHTGSVYFSTNMVLNHGAVNPLFSFFESINHQESIGDKYRFMENDKAEKLFSKMIYTSQRPDSIAIPIDNKEIKNVVIVVLESFSKYIMNEKGHVKGVTPCLEKLTTEGLYFDNFYANSFRTDRALVSILSGLPAQPTMSIMDHPHKSTSLPSIARTLGKKGWTTSFYYGGDMNYSNMQSYFVGTGFQNIVADKDFPQKLHTGKWGVADMPVYDRMFADIQSHKSSTPLLSVMMTESSHEPFDVPNYHKLKSPQLNAFSYADMCLGKFVEKLKQSPKWKNTLLLIVPDHIGAYPEQLDNYALWRYEIPLIMTGGVIKQPQRVPVIGCQTDIPATLLTILGYDHQDFTYSKDLFDPNAPHYAFFTLDDGLGIVTKQDQIIYDNKANKIIYGSGKNNITELTKAKAYLQKLYDDIDAR